MEPVLEGCSQCEYPVWDNYTLCVVCEEGKLCLKCSIADFPLCKNCSISQMIQTSQVETAQKGRPKCVLCGNVYGANECQKCHLITCNACDLNPLKHPCERCQGVGCSGKREHVCCNRCWCTTCFARHYNVCGQTKFYKCGICQGKVLTFGDPVNKCPVMWCVRGWGCTNCNVLRLEGLYCDRHISDNACPLCKKHYPCITGAGWGMIYIIKNGQRTPFVICACDVCMKKMRSLVESILILSKRKGTTFEKSLMNRLITYATKILQKK